MADVTCSVRRSANRDARSENHRARIQRGAKRFTCYRCKDGYHGRQSPLYVVLVDLQLIEPRKGKKNIEVRPGENVTKGSIVELLLFLHPTVTTCVCAGDDTTDQDMVS